ncbi:hypothetical protein ABPG72_001485 [Tetrahymena utriculariae]
MASVLKQQDIQSDSTDLDEESLSADQQEYEDFQDYKDVSFDSQVKQSLLQIKTEELVETLDQIDCDQSDKIADEVFGLKVMNSEKPRLAFENSYHIRSKGDIITVIVNEVKKISKIYNISSGNAFYLLRSCYYNFQNCIKIPHDQIKVMFPQQNLEKQQSQEIACEGCKSPLKNKNKYSFGCEHSLCKKCFEEYMQSALNQNQDIFSQTCPRSGCKEFIGLKEFLEFFKLIDDQEYLENTLIQDYIQKKPIFKKCDLFNCQNYFQIDQINNKSLYNLRCDCQQQFSCNSCGEQAHLPLTCEQKFIWDCLNQNCDYQIMQNTQYLNENAKACPNCELLIEKDGGCDHIICINCKTSFCWDCLEIIHSQKSKDKVSLKSKTVDNKSKLILLELQQEFKRQKYLVEQKKKNYQSNIKSIQESIELLFKNQNEFNKEMKSFIIPSLNLLIEGNIVYQYSIPLEYFEQNSQKLTLLNSLQKELKLKLDMLEKQLTEELSNQFNIQKLLKNNSIQDIDFKSKYDLIRAEIQKQVKEIIISLRYLFTHSNLVKFF